MLHAAAVGRLEAEAYMHDVVRNMPLTLEAFDVLLEDFGNYQKLEQRFQYSEVQTAIDNDINSGGTGHYNMTEKTAAATGSIAAIMPALTGSINTSLKSRGRLFSLIV